MTFGSVPLSEAAGAILAHSVALEKGRLRKGLRLEAEHLDRLRAAGIETVTVARLEPGDLHEDSAAERLAKAAVAGKGMHPTAPFTGRVNLIADGPGVVQLDAERLQAANAVNPMITIATVPPFQQMAKGGMIATVKIISYAVPEAEVERASELARGAIRFAAPAHASASLIITEISGGPGDKGAKAVAGRVAALGMELVEILRVPHEETRLSAAISAAKGEIVLILTGSATSDPYDTAPEALRKAGGVVERFGMPVDPGNLLFVGRTGQKPVIGLPGCARSPAINGADWVLSRVACGVPVTGADIAAMGVGGLLKEIPTRPQPRNAGR